MITIVRETAKLWIVIGESEDSVSGENYGHIPEYDKDSFARCKGNSDEMAERIATVLDSDSYNLE